MTQNSSLSPTPVPCVPQDQQDISTIAKIVENLADVLIDAPSLVGKCEQQAAEHRDQVLQSLEGLDAITARIHGQLDTISQQLVRLESATNALADETAKTAAIPCMLRQSHETLAFDLQQVRLLAECLVEKQATLTEDFIDRHITDHLFKEFLNIAFALGRYATNGNDDLRSNIQATSEGIESFLVQSGLRVIHPHQGEAFDPREHQPIKVIPTSDPLQQGAIAETFTPGLRRRTRVIQQARVAVYKAAAASPR